jgi:transposase
MNESAQTSLRGEDGAMGGVLHLAIEMGEKKWDLLFGGGEPKENGRVRTYRRTIAGRDWVELQEAVERAREKLKLGADVPVVSCYEAGQDGFWPHRKWEELGIAKRVVDSASIEVNRRFRRAKDDGLDVHKLLEMLIRAQGGERGVWREVRVPSVEEEDPRGLHRELERLEKEEKQHRTRMRSLFKRWGERPDSVPGGRGWREYLLGLKEQMGPRAWAELWRESERLELVKQQIAALEHERREAVVNAPKEDEVLQRVIAWSLLRGVGLGSAWQLVMEFFGWRGFGNRRQVAGCAGLDPTLYASGESRREQGISKAGNKRIRRLMVELAWSGLRYQSNSELSRWFRERFAHGGKRQRRIGIVALARRLLVAFWRYLQTGPALQGAMLKAAAR